jgi:membrane protein implicated in regulation of membrane protease activity
MIFLTMLFRRASWPARILMLAVLLLVFAMTIARVVKATHSFQERKTNVHTRSTSR